MKGASLHPTGPACDIDALSDAFTRSLGAEAGPSARQFLRQAQKDCVADELPDASAEEIGASLAELWRFGEQSDGEPLVRVRRWMGADGRDLGRDLLEIVQDDKPFLVDSIMGEVAVGGQSVRAQFHPGVELEVGRPRALMQGRSRINN